MAMHLQRGQKAAEAQWLWRPIGWRMESAHTVDRGDWMQTSRVAITFGRLREIVEGRW